MAEVGVLELPGVIGLGTTEGKVVGLGTVNTVELVGLAAVGDDDSTEVLELLAGEDVVSTGVLGLLTEEDGTSEGESGSDGGGLISIHHVN